MPGAMLTVRSLLLLDGHSDISLTTVSMAEIVRGPTTVHQHGSLCDPLVDAGHADGVQGRLETGPFDEAFAAAVRRVYVVHRLGETPALRVSVWSSRCDVRDDGSLLTTFDLTYRGHSFTQFPIKRGRTGAHGCDVELPEFQGTVLAGLDDWMIEVAVKAAFVKLQKPLWT